MEETRIVHQNIKNITQTTNSAKNHHVKKSLAK